MKQITSKTREELLINTVLYYGIDENRRSLSSKGYCSYQSDSGNCCAIGREIRIGLRYMLDELANTSVQEKEVFEALPKRLQNLGQDFLSRIQKLHDSLEYYDCQLNSDGWEHVEKIINHHSLNVDFKALQKKFNETLKAYTSLEPHFTKTYVEL